MILKRRLVISVKFTVCASTRPESFLIQIQSHSRCILHHERRSHHQQNGYCDERLPSLFAKAGRRQSDGRSGAFKDERRLTYLRNGQCHDGGNAHWIAEHDDRTGGDDRFEHEHAHRHTDDEQQVLDQEAEVQEHPDRYEKDGVEDRP